MRTRNKDRGLRTEDSTTRRSDYSLDGYAHHEVGTISGADLNVNIDAGYTTLYTGYSRGSELTTGTYQDHQAGRTVIGGFTATATNVDHSATADNGTRVRLDGNETYIGTLVTLESGRGGSTRAEAATFESDSFHLKERDGQLTRWVVSTEDFKSSTFERYTDAPEGYFATGRVEDETHATRREDYAEQGQLTRTETGGGSGGRTGDFTRSQSAESTSDSESTTNYGAGGSSTRFNTYETSGSAASYHESGEVDVTVSGRHTAGDYTRTQESSSQSTRDDRGTTHQTTVATGVPENPETPGITDTTTRGTVSTTSESDSVTTADESGEVQDGELDSGGGRREFSFTDHSRQAQHAERDETRDYLNVTSGSSGGEEAQSTSTGSATYSNSSESESRREEQGTDQSVPDPLQPPVIDLTFSMVEAHTYESSETGSVTDQYGAEPQVLRSTSRSQSKRTAHDSISEQGTDEGTTVTRSSSTDETAIDRQSTSLRAGSTGSTSATQFSSSLTREGEADSVIVEPLSGEDTRTTTESADSSRHESASGRRDETSRVIVRSADVSGEPDQTDRTTTTTSRNTSGSSGHVAVSDTSSRSVELSAQPDYGEVSTTSHTENASLGLSDRERNRAVTTVRVHDGVVIDTLYSESESHYDTRRIYEGVIEDRENFDTWNTDSVTGAQTSSGTWDYDKRDIAETLTTWHDVLNNVNASDHHVDDSGRQVIGTTNRDYDFGTYETISTLSSTSSSTPQESSGSLSSNTTSTRTREWGPTVETIDLLDSTHWKKRISDGEVLEHTRLKDHRTELTGERIDFESITTDSGTNSSWSRRSIGTDELSSSSSRSSSSASGTRGHFSLYDLNDVLEEVDLLNPAWLQRRIEESFVKDIETTLFQSTATSFEYFSTRRGSSDTTTNYTSGYDTITIHDVTTSLSFSQGSRATSMSLEGSYSSQYSNHYLLQGEDATTTVIDIISLIPGTSSYSASETGTSGGTWTGLTRRDRVWSWQDSSGSTGAGVTTTDQTSLYTSSSEYSLTRNNAAVDRSSASRSKYRSASDEQTDWSASLSSGWSYDKRRNSSQSEESEAYHETPGSYTWTKSSTGSGSGGRYDYWQDTIYSSAPGTPPVTGSGGGSHVATSTSSDHYDESNTGFTDTRDSVYREDLVLVGGYSTWFEHIVDYDGSATAGSGSYTDVDTTNTPEDSTTTTSTGALTFTPGASELPANTGGLTPAVEPKDEQSTTTEAAGNPGVQAPQEEEWFPPIAANWVEAEWQEAGKLPFVLYGQVKVELRPDASLTDQQVLALMQAGIARKIEHTTERFGPDRTEEYIVVRWPATSDGGSTYIVLSKAFDLAPWHEWLNGPVQRRWEVFVRYDAPAFLSQSQHATMVRGWIDNRVHQETLSAIDTAIGVVEFARDAWPVIGTASAFQKGDWKQGLVSLAGDAAIFLGAAYKVAGAAVQAGRALSVARAAQTVARPTTIVGAELFEMGGGALLGLTQAQTAYEQGEYRTTAIAVTGAVLALFGMTLQFAKASKGAARVVGDAPDPTWVSTWSEVNEVNARRLRNNMDSDGIQLADGEAAHHIAQSTSKHPAAVEARGILEKYQIDINDPVNGVPLTQDLHRRRGLHSGAYQEKVLVGLERVLDANRGKSWREIRDALSQKLTEMGELQRAGVFMDP